jgi:hypothetical protein
VIPRSSLPYVLARLRCPTHLLEYPHWASLHVPEVAAAAKECHRRTWRRFQTSFRRMDICIVWRLGFRQSSFHRIARIARRAAPYVWTQPPFPGMLLSLNTLSGRGKPSDSRTFLRVHPDCIGNTTERLAAQFRHITRVPQRTTPYAWTWPLVSWHALVPYWLFDLR